MTDTTAPSRRPMADNEVLVQLMSDGPGPVTHGIRMPVDRIAHVGVIHHEGRHFIFQRVERGNPIFLQTGMLDLSPPAEPKKRSLLRKLFG